ncbi:uncharacterized protein LOC121991081 [Zingiber officinale]|uniref:uncharacterized protein LOC121991081 n=1 Tax=Zingiber officinale TaxID=94328 RepID=UPI001C4D7682|nr:uncharacterized protein LOC121991081 [Zingiber officinale]
MKLEVEEPLDEKHVRLHKRVREVSTSYEQTLYNNVLGEPGSLGLRPRKSKDSKRRADSTPHSTPPPPEMKLEVEEPLDEKHVRLHKRARDVSTSYEQALYNNVLGEPGPLGLRPRKSKTLCFTSSKGSEVGEQSDFSASSSSLSKIKASNFPASLLRIGTWECVSRYEGDLVAKCYLAKHKLVWEVLEGGLKSKIEFYWSDITAIKAVFFEGSHGTLDIVLARPPLFF